MNATYSALRGGSKDPNFSNQESATLPEQAQPQETTSYSPDQENTMATQTQTVPDEATHKPMHVRTNPQVSGSIAPCPDPSVHNTRNTALQEQASTAALYVTNSSRGTHVGNFPLDADNKISSAGNVLHDSTTIFNFIDLTLCRSRC